MTIKTYLNLYCVEAELKLNFQPKTVGGDNGIMVEDVKILVNRGSGCC